jgi:hypothetical protein
MPILGSDLLGRRAAGNGLLNNLIAYWPGNEVSGNALDLHTNALHLTDVNTVTSNPGLVYPLARQYTLANSEYHARNSEALLQTGDIDFTFAAWCRMDTKMDTRDLISKWDSGANKREFMLRYRNATDEFTWYASPDGTANSQVGASTFGSPGVNTWYLIIVHHDSVVNEIGIQVSNGAIDTLAYATGVNVDTSPFWIGYGPVEYWDGRIGPTMFWKSAAGGGGVLTTVQRTALYAGGLGLPYASFTT